MTHSSFISILLAFLFMAKFLAIDANGITLFNEQGKVTYINTHCKKLNPPKTMTSFSKSDTWETQHVLLPGLCSQQFILETVTEEAPTLLRKFTLNTFHKTELSYRYLEHIVPPPRV
ncbi:MAG: hypothetical protein ACSHXF_10350 [Aquaticitalea sp.]